MAADFAFALTVTETFRAMANHSAVMARVNSEVACLGARLTPLFLH
jgi:hypothetical protein